MKPALRVLLAIPWLLLPDTGTASGQRVFRDWVATCDNARHCAAFGLSLEHVEPRAFLAFERAGAGDAPISNLRLELAEGAPEAAGWSLYVGERRLFEIAPSQRECGGLFGPGRCGIVRFDGHDAQARAILVALRADDMLTLVVGDEIAAGVSLDGATAALLWIDEQQRRLGTVTALVRRGEEPADRIPAPPARPRVDLARGAWTALPEAEVRVLAERLADRLPETGCDRTDTSPIFGDRGWTTREGHVLVALHCFAAAYNDASLWYLAPPDGEPRPLELPRPPGFDVDGDETHELPGATFDPAEGVILSVAKGRAYGDCGAETRWGWTGAGFALLELRAFSECRGVGPDAWPTIHRADWR
jgi:hypothetical protein